MQYLGSGPPMIYFFYVHTAIRLKYMVLFHLFFFFCVQPFDQKLGSSLIISFICTLPFDQIILSSFIYSFFSTRPFDQKLGSSLIQFFICTRPFDQKLVTLIYLFYLYRTIRPKIRVLIGLFPLFAHDHLTKK